METIFNKTNKAKEEEEAMPRVVAEEVLPLEATGLETAPVASTSAAAKILEVSQPIIKLVDISRGERALRRSAKRTRRAATDDSDDDTDASVFSLPLSSCGKKQGRPPTTAECVGLAEARRRYIEEREREAAFEREDLIFDRAADTTPSRGSKPLPDEEMIQSHLRLDTVGGLGAQVMECAADVERVARHSMNLKGTSKRQLRLAAQRWRLLGAELAKRCGGEHFPELQDRIRDLETKVKVLEEENKRLSRFQREGPREAEEPRPRHSPSPAVAAALSTVEDRMRAVAVGDTPLTPRQGERHLATRSSSPTCADADNDLRAFVRRELQEFRREILRTIRPASRECEAPQERDARAGQCSANDIGNPDKAEERRKKKKKKKKGKESDPGEVARPKGPVAKLPPKPAPSQVEGGSKKDHPTDRSGGQEAWTTVVGRKQRAAAKKAHAPSAKQCTTTKGAGKSQPSRVANPKPRPPKAPKSAAVSVTVPEGCTVTYAEAMAKARAAINLAELGIGQVRPKRAINGGLLLELPGGSGAVKATALAAKMTAALEGTGVLIAKPQKTAEMRVVGLDDSVTPVDVLAAFAALTGLQEGEIKVGEIRRSPSGLGSAWVRCPLAEARKAIDAGRVMVGWSSARIDFLPARPLQCRKCLLVGHVRSQCTSAVDRTSLCYRCGVPGHVAVKCTATTPSCPVCRDAGLKADHRMGSKACSPPKVKAGRRGGGMLVLPPVAKTCDPPAGGLPVSQGAEAMEH